MFCCCSLLTKGISGGNNGSDSVSPTFSTGGFRASRWHPLDTLLTQLSPGSHRAFRVALNGLSRFLSRSTVEASAFPWHTLRYADSVRIRAFLGQHYSANSANFSISAFRAVMKECWRLGRLDTDTYHRVIDIPRFRGNNEGAGRALTKEELAHLLDACLSDAPLLASGMLPFSPACTVQASAGQRCAA